VTPAGTTRHAANQVEVRWALADWGKIPLNPTIYVEWKAAHDAPDAYEVKLLLSETLAPRWHWGMNLAHEQEVSGDRETEWAVSQAFSYTLIDEKLSAGVEMLFEHATVAGERSNPEIEFLIGPSLEWRPTSRTTLNLVPLFGVTHDSPHIEAFVVFAVDFGCGKEREEHAPASLRAN
jgi:hypothetical protein